MSLTPPGTISVTTQNTFRALKDLIFSHEWGGDKAYNGNPSLEVTQNMSFSSDPSYLFNLQLV